jgi:predicted small metal-binding protein
VGDDFVHRQWQEFKCGRITQKQRNEHPVMLVDHSEDSFCALSDCRILFGCDFQLQVINASETDTKTRNHAREQHTENRNDDIQIPLECPRSQQAMRMVLLVFFSGYLFKMLLIIT